MDSPFLDLAVHSWICQFKSECQDNSYCIVTNFWLRLFTMYIQSDLAFPDCINLEILVRYSKDPI